MAKSVLRDKSYSFAIDIVKTCRSLQNDKKEYVISRQLLRSGTAIGALIREAEFAESRADFVHKMKIALKEANETEYWLLLLADTYNPGQGEWAANIHSTCRELIAMLISTVKTIKSSS